MTAKQLSAKIGLLGTIKVKQCLDVSVEVVDAKLEWGQVRLQIRPVAGSGMTWVNQDSVQLG